MNGKVIVAFLVLPAVIAGAALYYLQIFSFYEEVIPNGDNGRGNSGKEN